jgi:hypothetical protein
MFVVVLDALELALLGTGGNFGSLARARREGSYSAMMGGIVVTYIFTVLASLGLTTYPRDRGGEGWNGARRRFVSRGSLGNLRCSWVD